MFLKYRVKPMKTLGQTRKLILKNKKTIQRNFYVKDLFLFGSFARSAQKRDSDVDILVDFKKPVGLFKFLELEEYLECLLGTKVDLVTRKALYGKIGQNILQECQKI